MCYKWISIESAHPSMVKEHFLDLSW